MDHLPGWTQEAGHLHLAEVSSLLVLYLQASLLSSTIWEEDAILGLSDRNGSECGYGWWRVLKKDLKTRPEGCHPAEQSRDTSLQRRRGRGGHGRQEGMQGRLVLQPEKRAAEKGERPGVGAAEMGWARVALPSAPARPDISSAICAVASHGQLETSRDGRMDSVEIGKPCTWSSPL